VFFQTVFTSLLIILLGLGLTFAGYRFFVILVSIWGFFAGFHFGASILSNWFGQGFLTTVIGWVIGLLVGVFAAAIAYLFYEAAVILLAGFVGYELGVGIMTWIGLQPGFIMFLVGLAGALALAALAVILRFPKILLIVLTAFAGAGAILAGFFLAFGRLSLADLQFGTIGAIVRDRWIWGVLYLALAGVGILIQWGTTEHYVHDAEVTGRAAPASAADTAMNGSSTLVSPALSTATSTNGASPASTSTTDTPVTGTVASE
jgi:Domain of unknown function (DUF4203)